MPTGPVKILSLPRTFPDQPSAPWQILLWTLQVIQLSHLSDPSRAPWQDRLLLIFNSSRGTFHPYSNLPLNITLSVNFTLIFLDNKFVEISVPLPPPTPISFQVIKTSGFLAQSACRGTPGWLRPGERGSPAPQPWPLLHMHTPWRPWAKEKAAGRCKALASNWPAVSMVELFSWFGSTTDSESK